MQRAAKTASPLIMVKVSSPRSDIGHLTHPRRPLGKVGLFSTGRQRRKRSSPGPRRPVRRKGLAVAVRRRHRYERRQRWRCHARAKMRPQSDHNGVQRKPGRIGTTLPDTARIRGTPRAPRTPIACSHGRNGRFQLQLPNCQSGCETCLPRQGSRDQQDTGGEFYSRQLAHDRSPCPTQSGKQPRQVEADQAPGRLGLFNDFCAPAPDRDVLRRAHHIG